MNNVIQGLAMKVYCERRTRRVEQFVEGQSILVVYTCTDAIVRRHVTSKVIFFVSLLKFLDLTSLQGGLAWTLSLRFT